MNDKFELMYSKFTYSGKPQTFDKDVQSWYWYEIKEVDINEMVKLICEGRCWRNGTYDVSKRRFIQENVSGSHFIALDFDKSTIPPQDVIKYATSIELTPNFWYYSYSQGKKPGYNYRVVWVYNEEFEAEEWKAIYKLFLWLFRDFNPDKQTKDASRFWYGTNGIEKSGIITNTLNKINSLQKYNSFIERYSAAIAREQGNFGNKSALVKVGSDWSEKLFGVCDLWRNFVKGYYLNRAQRFILFSNLREIFCEEKSITEKILEITNWKVYDETHSFGISELERWFHDDSVSPKKIIDFFDKKLTVAEYFATLSAGA